MEILDTDILSAELVYDTSKGYASNPRLAGINFTAAISGMTKKYDWGDGTIDTAYGHTYTENGIYTVKIYNVNAISLSVTLQSAIYNRVKGYTSCVIYNSITSIEDDAFYMCSNLKSIVIADSVTNIGSSVFSGCSSLESIIIPKNVTKIKSSVFSGCSSLTSITIPNGVTSIGAQAFYNCRSLTNIFYLGTTLQWNSLLSNTAGGSGNSYFTNATVYFMVTYSYETNGGTLEAGFDNPNTAASYPDPLPTVTLGNFTFGGWYTDNNFITGITAGDGIEESTIYAKLSSGITYNLNGGYNNSGNSDYYTSVDASNGKPLFAANKENYNFEGWYTEPTFENKVEDLSDYTNGGDIELYAKFEPRKSYRAKHKDSTMEALPLDAQTVRGLEAYVNIDITNLANMEQLYAKIVEINAKNEHALFNFSSYIENAYCCLVRMYEELGTKYCEIIDLINGTKYLNIFGYEYSTPIDEYLETCTVEDKYSSVKISPENIQTVAELINYIDKLNDKGEHCFFDFSECSGVTSSAYCCTVQSYVQQGITYLFIFDMINGRLYGDYDGITEDLDTLTLGTYLDGNCETGNLLSTLTIWEGYDLAYIYRMVNRIAGIDHHIILDLTHVNGPEILASIGFVTETDGMTVKVIGLTTGSIYQHKYTGSTESVMVQLETTLLRDFLATYIDNIATESYVNNAIGTVLNTPV